MAAHSLGFFITLTCVLLTKAINISPGEILFVQDRQSSGRWNIAATNGKFYIHSVSNGVNIIECDMGTDDRIIAEIMNSSPAEVKTLGVDAISEMIQHCEQVKTMNFFKDKEAEKRKRDSNNSSMPFAPEKTGQPSGGGLGLGIFPGTKWCGLGNEASSYQDLGKFNLTDACCRDHDHCPYFIDHFETKYNYKNPYPWTLSHCDCDNKLYNCLKEVNTTASNEVGKLFFGLLNVNCFTFEKGEYCVQRHWSGLFCEKKAYGEKAITQKFPHQWGDDVFG